MGSIYWSALTWEAVATFTAVVAAAWVGIRQVAISERQTEILDRQVRLDELKLRSELFQRRFAVYESTKGLLVEVVQRADKADAETERAFLIGLDQAKFLFHQSVHDQLDGVWRDYCRFGAIKSQMAASYEASGEYGAGHVDAEADLLDAFSEKFTNLAATFGDEMLLATIADAPAAARPKLLRRDNHGTTGAADKPHPALNT